MTAVLSPLPLGEGRDEGYSATGHVHGWSVALTLTLSQRERGLGQEREA